MSYGNFALIIVDVQYDFLPGGALAVPGGDQIIHPIANISRDASLVVASRDWHPENHFTFSDDPQYIDQSWPPHCVQRTKGAKIYPSLNRLAHFVISKGMDRNTEAYSAFAGKTLRPVQTLEEILRNVGVRTVVVTGLALDYCVQFTALDANALGYRTVVPLCATRAVAKESEQDALNRFQTAGVEVVEYFNA